MRTLAFLFGSIFILLGIAGFIPQLYKNGLLFEVFHVNSMLIAIHLITGILAIVVGMISRAACRLFFQIVGIVYGVKALFGFIYGPEMIFGIIANNIQNTWFHVIVAVFALIIGYSSED